MLFIRFFCMVFLFTSFLAPSWAMEETKVDARRTPFSKIMAKRSIGPDDSAWKKVIRSFEKKKNKKKINLSNKNLIPNDIKFVLDFLKNRPLKKLILSHNFLGDEGARLISEELRYIPGLKVLDLRNNNIGNEGLAFIREALKDVPLLKSFRLEGNNFEEGEIDIIHKFNRTKRLFYIR